jgi:hypothetical protein
MQTILIYRYTIIAKDHCGVPKEKLRWTKKLLEKVKAKYENKITRIDS